MEPAENTLPPSNGTQTNSAVPDASVQSHPLPNPITFVPLVSPVHANNVRKIHPATREWHFPGSMRFTLIGHSRAADETGFYIPELCWGLDAGAKVYSAYPEYLFVTHTHSDHSYQLIRMVSRRTIPMIYVHSEMVDLVENYLLSAQELGGARSLPSDIIHEPTHVTRGVTPGESFPLVRAKAGSRQGPVAAPPGVAKYCVDVIACDHSCPTVGFLFYELRQKLLPEYANLSGPKIKYLRDNGYETTYSCKYPLFAFMGDTTAKIFQNDPIWLADMPVVITECTFLDEGHRENAERTRHTIWGDLEPIIRKYPKTTFVLIHFSHRYSEKTIRDFFESMVDAPHNIVVWSGVGVEDS